MVYSECFAVHTHCNHNCYNVFCLTKKKIVCTKKCSRRERLVVNVLVVLKKRATFTTIVELINQIPLEFQRNAVNLTETRLYKIHPPQARRQTKTFPDRETTRTGRRRQGSAGSF